MKGARGRFFDLGVKSDIRTLAFQMSECQTPDTSIYTSPPISTVVNSKPPTCAATKL